MSGLYEYPEDYIGRKTYVTVRGHSRSVPKYKTYLGTDSRYHLHPDFGGDFSGYGNATPYIMPDKLAYVSPIDGSSVTSRSHHREHMKRHNVLEAGDVKMGHMSNKERTRMPRAGYDIKRAIEQLRSR